VDGRAKADHDESGTTVPQAAYLNRLRKNPL
jgi:hypothetical protein